MEFKAVPSDEVMEMDHSNQPGLEPVRHPDPVGPNKPEQSAYGFYGGGPPYSSPQNSYGSPEQYNSNAAYAPQVVDPAEQGAGERRFLGLRATTFFLICAIIALIIAAAVGGGVGGSIAVKNAKDSCRSEAAANISAISASLASATKTKTSSSAASKTSSSSSSASETAVASASQPWGAVGTDLGSSGCPQANQTVYTSTFGKSKFKIFCNADEPGNDLLQTIVTTIGLCMEACGSWNQSPNIPEKCAGIAFVPSFIDGDGGGSPVDCYLKAVANESALAPNANYVVDFAIIQ